MENNRVCCLYRVSTDKQVDYDNNNEADIPMQRKACHRFAEKMGWTIVHEEQEDGVSGHKIRAENRDKIQAIKELARKGKFDILLVFMFDRIGRIADETPFVVEWFVKNGIQVWSTQEGEQRFDNHIDKLLNYIRFWQADGESEKTSIRTRTSLGQMVEEGHYKGGNAALGYELVKSGRLNKRKHELYDLKVKEEDAAIVRLIFDKYTKEGLGVQKIANFLNNGSYFFSITAAIPTLRATAGRTTPSAMCCIIRPTPAICEAATAVLRLSLSCKLSRRSNLIVHRRFCGSVPMF